MSNQVVSKGGSVCMVWKKKGESERYIGAIEPYKTVERLHELQAFNKRHADEHRVLRMQEEYGMIVKRTSSIRKRENEKPDSKVFSKARTGYRMPKKSEPMLTGMALYPKQAPIRKIGTVPVMMTETPTTEKMVTKKKSTTYNVKDLTRLQKLEAQNRSCEGEFQSGKLTPQAEMNMADRIRSNEKEIDKITQGTHKTGMDIAKDRKKGRIIVVDDEGNVY